MLHILLFVLKIIGIIITAILGILVSVSYTHLDVYKRQVLYICVKLMYSRLQML